MLRPKIKRRFVPRREDFSPVGELPVYEGPEYLILPGGPVGIKENTNKFLDKVALLNRYFTKGRAVVEVVVNKRSKKPRLLLVSPEAFRSQMEQYFKLYAWRVGKRGEAVLKPTIASFNVARGMLVSDPMLARLPEISLVVNCPIFTENAQKELVVLGYGYNPLCNGIFNTCAATIENDLPLEKAKRRLWDTVSEYSFRSPADRSRAMGMIIAPALRLGGLLPVDTPALVMEADQSQAGKGYHQQVICAIYNETPYVIAKKREGVGSFDESFATALASGRFFIIFDNIRGFLDSELTESAIRGHGLINCRTFHREELQVETGQVVLMLSSNGVNTTRDLANRSVMCQIQKREGVEWKAYREGDLLAHVRAKWSTYLGYVYAVVREWHQRGKPKTKESRHDLREWTQAMDYIICEILGGKHFMDGHKEEQIRISNPVLNWLREVAEAVKKEGKLDSRLRSSDIREACENQAVPSPTGKEMEDIAFDQLIGRLLKQEFKKQDYAPLKVGGYSIRLDNVFDDMWRREVSVYTFSNHE